MPVRRCLHPTSHHLTICHSRMAILGKLYSNTLLVSLNNRISIRESVATSGLTFRTLPVTSIGHRSEHSSDAMIMRPPAAKAYKARTLADNEEHEKMVVLVTRETQSEVRFGSPGCLVKVPQSAAVGCCDDGNRRANLTELKRNAALVTREVEGGGDYSNDLR
ncbi:hypothetical protein BGW80DRAFT_1447218 [Lactifluus volemus]|nr:hypothetical protein BGW80DRAFT_1447218 [Lactifluus volemus]